jgi:hypothetical protein
VEQVCTARSAQAAWVDLSRAAVISSQLPTDRLSKIYIRLARKVTTLREEPGELGGYLRSDLVTAGSNARADRDHQVLGPGTELAGHSLERCRYYFEYSTAPASVNRRDGSVSRIGHQDGKTVGSANGERDAWGIRDHRVTLADIPRSAGNEHPIRVNLPKGRKF